MSKEYYRRPENYIPQSYNPIDLAYLAGIIDGEGCLGIYKIKTKTSTGFYHRGVLKIDNTQKELIDWLINTFKGTHSAATRITPSKKYERDIYTWCVTGDKLLNLCEQILPYLTIKKPNCENMIKFRKTFLYKIGHNKKIEPELLDIREACFLESRKLNSGRHLRPLKSSSPLSP